MARPRRPMLLVTLGSLLLCSFQAALPPRPVTALEERCAACHGELVDSWRRTGMSQASGPLRPGELEGLQSVAEEGTGYRYHYEQGDGAPLLVETRAAPQDGGEDHRVALPVSFAIGAGRLDRSYVLERSGRMWFSPLEVLSATGRAPRRVTLGPGHMMVPGTRFDLPIERDCLGCHAGAAPPPLYPLNVQPAADSWRATGISCDACHTATSSHADWQEAALGGQEPGGEDPVGRQAELARSVRMSTCAACHLQGDARFELTPVSLGPIGDRPQPGEDLLLKRAYYVARRPTAEIGFVSQTERLVLSECYIRSAAFAERALDCTSCHDPHRSLESPRERARVRAGCLQCHPRVPRGEASLAGACSAPTPKSPDRDCVDCHMPRRPVFDVAHVEIHDHRILARPDKGPASFENLRLAEAPDGDWQRFRWPELGVDGPPDEAGLRLMAFVQGGHWERAAALADAPAGDVAETLPLFHHLRAFLLENLGRHGDARAAYERALELDPSLPAASVNLSLRLTLDGETEAAIELASALLEQSPLAVAALRHRAIAHHRRGDWEAVTSDLERAFALHADADLAALLADFHRERGNPERARRWRLEAARLDPLRHGPR